MRTFRSSDPGSPEGLRYGIAIILLATSTLAAQRGATDLDRLMQRATARRDENWKKLRQYVLDEHVVIDVRGPDGSPLVGDRRDFTWFIRDGYFVRSPVRANGVTFSEEDRHEYEEAYLRREREREKRRQEGKDAGKDAGQDAGNDAAGPPPAVPATPESVGALLRQTTEPRFISAAYFLDFRFEPGNYLFAGREPFDGRDVLRVEYYPTKLFGAGDDDEARHERRHGRKPDERRRRREQELERKMNKVALITLWIEPRSAQIVKYTFQNVRLDFLPLGWLVRIEDISATMAMGQPFPDVWLPRAIDMHVALNLANGTYDMRYGLEFSHYRQADVTSKIRVPRQDGEP